MHKVFISYHHDNDQSYKEALLSLNGVGDQRVFIDESVDTGDIDDNLSDEAIREKIRDEYLRKTTVTIVLVGLETKKRKHIDWEIYSSMFDGTVNKKSGIVVIVLPSADQGYVTAPHAGEKETLHPDWIGSWTTISDRPEFNRRYPYLSERLIDNLLLPEAKISVVPWSTIEGDRDKLAFLIEATYKDRVGCKYDMSRPLMRRDG